MFKRRKETPPARPIRKDQVRRLVDAMWEEHEAAMVAGAAEIPQLDQAWERAMSVVEAAKRNCTPEEIKFANTVYEWEGVGGKWKPE